MPRKTLPSDRLTVDVDRVLQLVEQEQHALVNAYKREGLDPSVPQVGNRVSVDNRVPGMQRYIYQGRVIHVRRGVEMLLRAASKAT